MDFVIHIFVNVYLRRKWVFTKDNIHTYLHDIIHSGKAIKQFIADCSFEEYTDNELIRSAVERKFDIMGEAINRIYKEEPDTLSQVRDYRGIISFRNILIHGYDTIDDLIVWGVVDEYLDNLIKDVEKLITKNGNSVGQWIVESKK